MAAARRLALMLCLALGVAGCAEGPEIVARREATGLVCVFPGVMTNALWFAPATSGLRAGGVEASIHVVEWERPVYDILGHLQDIETNRRSAGRAAALIATYHAAHPDAPVDLVGYSAGGGMAIFVAEALDDTVHVRNVVLAQPAISPRYDLTPALRHVDGRLTLFYSPSDVVILGLGTRAFGTIDRSQTDSAGMVGFDVDAAVADPKLRERLFQVRWRPEMIWSGHFGDHGGILSNWWNRDFVAPELLRPIEHRLAQ